MSEERIFQTQQGDWFVSDQGPMHLALRSATSLEVSQAGRIAALEADLAALRQALEHFNSRLTPMGDEQGEWTTAYMVLAGPWHQVLGLLRGVDGGNTVLARIAALEAERDAAWEAWRTAESRIAALMIEREALTVRVRDLTSDLEAEWLDPDRKLHGVSGLVYTPDPDKCDPRMMRIDDPKTGAMGFGKGLWDAAYDLYGDMRDRLTASQAERDAAQAHAARLASAGEALRLRTRHHRHCDLHTGESEDVCSCGFWTDRDAWDAALAATPADSRERQQAERAVVEAARAVVRGWEALCAAVPTGNDDAIEAALAEQEDSAEALTAALAALDAGEGRDGD